MRFNKFNKSAQAAGPCLLSGLFLRRRGAGAASRENRFLPCLEMEAVIKPLRSVLCAVFCPLALAQDTALRVETATLNL
jgi:hypothetical protein